MTQHHPKTNLAATRAKMVALTSAAYDFLEETPSSPALNTVMGNEQETQIGWYRLDQLLPSSKQPRRHFELQDLQQLAASFKTHGCKSVIVIRPLQNEHYEIVAGERRYRAAKIAGLDKVLCLVASLSDEEAFEFALVENEHREDLSALELTHGILELIQLKHQIHRERSLHLIRTEGHPRKRSGGHASTSTELQTIIQVIESFGLKLETFRTRHLKLLDLPNELRDAHLAGKLGLNHALTLNRIKDQGRRRKLLEETMKQGHSVEKIKEKVRQTLKGSQSKTSKQAGEGPPREVVRLWNQLKTAPIWNDATLMEPLIHAMQQALGIEPEWRVDALTE